MQEWLKDKKNLPIVVALAIFFLAGAGGLIALELGLFNPGTSAAPPAQAQQSIPSGPPGAGGPPGGAAAPAGGGRPGIPAGMPQGGAGMPRGGGEMPRGGAPLVAAAAAAPKSDVVNPLVGPDPFKIPGGAQKLALQNAKLAPPKPALRTVIGPLDLFQIHAPTPTLVSGPVTPSANLAANYRLSGVIQGSDGINAIIEVGGQSQSVKPGDSLPDGTQVQNIQATSITLRSPEGSVFNLPLSAGTPDQGGAAPFNGPPQYNPGGFGGPPQYPNGFNPNGFNPNG